MEIILAHCKNNDFIVNNTMHELYFDQVVIFWIKYNEAPPELYCRSEVLKEIEIDGGSQINM